MKKREIKLDGPKALVISGLMLLLIGPGPSGAQQNAPLVLVGLAEQTALVEEVPVSGSVVSSRIANLSTEVSGIVDSLSVDIGERVSAGDEILRLNAELQRLSLEATRAETEQVVHELEDARRRLTDARKLGKIQSVSANAIESLAAEVRIDSARLKRAQAEQRRLEAQLARHRLTAPFGGIISRKLVEQGEWIQPGETVVELTALSNLRIDFRVPQSVFAKLDKSTRLRISLDAFPGESFDGKIDTIIPVTDPGNRTFLLRASVDGLKSRLAAGMSASAILRLNTDARGVVVPRDALIRYPDGRVTVWVVEQQGDQASVKERQVRTGIGFNGGVSITSGIEPDTLIVVQGNEALYDGQSVVVRRAE